MARQLWLLVVTVLFAFATWITTSWILVLAHALTRWPLTVAGTLEFALGLAWLIRRGLVPRRDQPEIDGWTAIAWLVVILPIVVWLVFVVWRGTVVPVYNHDALAYHLPKAVLLMKGRGFAALDVPEARIATWPCNYELLLSDTMILSQTDHYTAAVDTMAYVGILFASALLAARWWGGGVHVVVVTSVIAAIPIMILHSGIHKNDLLESFFALVVFTAAARWLVYGSAASLTEATIALLLSIGTKINGFLFLAAATPLLCAGALRHRSVATARRCMAFVAAALAASLLCGSASYVENLIALHKLVLPPQMTGGTGYGDWSNIWEFTTMVLLHPFSRSQAIVWNPFAHAYFWWATNDVWMSHFGAVVSLLAVAITPCAIRYRRRGALFERTASSLSALGAYVLTLPIHMHPRGFFAIYGRYIVFMAPFVVAWTVSPMMIELGERAGRRRYTDLVVCVACAVSFARSAIEFGIDDSYEPFEWVEYLVQHPEDRVPFARRNRAASIFDRVAKPDARCAMDVSYDTWIYPAYGEHWTRDVQFLRPTAGRVSIPDDVDWVLIDRSWNYFFGNPGFVDMSRADLLGKGEPTREDLKVYRQLRADDRFELVYQDRPQVQAIFRRKSASEPERGFPPVGQ
jgi:hypothetical protein